MGYHSALHGQKTYNSVAILAKSEHQNVVHGIPDEVDDAQAQVITAMVNGVRVVSVYVPNGQAVDSPASEFKD